MEVSSRVGGHGAGHGNDGASDLDKSRKSTSPSPQCRPSGVLLAQDLVRFFRNWTSFVLML